MTSHDHHGARDGPDDGRSDHPEGPDGPAKASHATTRTGEAAAGVDDAEEEPVVLAVDDEPRIVDLFETWLSDRYTVRTALDGRQAIEELDDEVDVVLLDRRMPGLSGDDVLAEIIERGLGCRVAMVTAVEPDFDIIEMGFDDYLTKPTSTDELVETIERLLTRSAYDEQIREHFALVSKKAALDAEKPRSELEASDEYARLEEEIARTRGTVDEALAGLDDEEFRSLLRELPQGS